MHQTMNTLYRLLLYIHILSVTLSIGPFFVLIPMMRKLRAAEPHAQHAYLDTFRFTIRLAKHAGHVLVVSGILLVIFGPWSWTTSWIVITVIILVGSLLFLSRAFSPTLRKLSGLVQERETLVRKLSRAIWIYIILLMMMLWFMVTRPSVW